MAMMNWHIVTSAEYAVGVKVDDDLYFLSDTHEIYRGNESYTQSITMYSELPASGALNRLYINSTTLEGKIWNGTNWVDILKPIASTISPDGTSPVSGAAVAQYVSAQLQTAIANENVVKNLSYDSTEKLITVTKGDDSSTTLVLNGLGCSLSYSGGNLQLLDHSGAAVGDKINLGTERFVQGGAYDEETQTIVLWFDDAEDADSATDKIEIPVGDLVDTYTVENTPTVNLTLLANTISAAVNISAEPGNAIQAKADGIYAPSVDTTGLMPKVTPAVEGNIPTLGADGTLVDSGVSLEGIGSSSTLFQGSSLSEAVGEATPKKNDVCIVSEQIGTSDKYSRTAYIHNGETWVACDGNVNAENVYFAQDLITTSVVGNITLTNGQATIPAAGKNLKQVFDTIFVKERNPNITQPSVSVSAPNNKAYEVGTSVTPTYTATLNAGNYQYGPATGITATSWNITDTDSHSASTNAGQFDAFTVGDGTNYRITATANYDAGAIPVTNVGNEYPTGQIAAGSKTGYSAYITGYRCGFYGTLTNKDGEINSALVRSLSGKTSSAPAAGTKWDLAIPVGAQRIVFAYPATIRDVSSVLDVNGMNAEIKTAFTKYTVDVEGANGYTAISYKVYVMDRATAADAANTYTITL